MTLSLTHAFVSAIADDSAAAAAGEVLPSHWNAAHALSGGTSGSVLFVDGSGNLAQDNANLNWDDTNDQLSIGGTQTASHSLLTVAGTQYRGGTTTATMPFVLFKVNGGRGTPCAWNTGGTIWGTDIDGSFTGNLIDFQFAGNQIAFVDYQGTATFGNIYSYHDVNCARYLNVGGQGNSIPTRNWLIFMNTALADPSAAVRLDDALDNGLAFFGKGATTGDGPTALRVYNAWSSSGANYERGVFDWLGTSNVLTIGTQKAGTGVARNMQFVVGGTVELDYGVTNASNWTLGAPVVTKNYTVSTLPTGVAGAMAYVTDGTAALAWGATVTGGASTKYLVWYNGSNWTVAGK